MAEKVVSRRGGVVEKRNGGVSVCLFVYSICGK